MIYHSKIKTNLDTFIKIILQWKSLNEKNLFKRKKHFVRILNITSNMKFF